MTSSFREWTEQKELDAMDDDIAVCKYRASRRISRRSNCTRCALVSRECDELKKKLDAITNEYEILKEKSGFIDRRENKTPLTILLFIANDQRLNPQVYDILDNQLDLQTQCMMLLHRKEHIVNEALDKIDALQSKDKDIIKSVIFYYFGITDSMTAIAFESKQEQFLFSVIVHSIDRCGRILNVLTHAFWQCVHYLTIFMYDVVPNFERYISRYIPLKLPGSIIDDICIKYNYVFSNGDFNDPLRTLKDVIHSCSNEDTDATHHKSPHIQIETRKADDVNDENDDDDDDDELLDAEDISALQHQMKCSEEWLTETTTASDVSSHDVSDDDTKLDPTAADFVPAQPPNKDHLCTISEECAMSETEEILSPSTASLISTISAVSPVTPCCSVIAPSDDDVEASGSMKYSINKPPQAPNDDHKSVENFQPKSGNRSRSNFFISKPKISRLASECAESFDTHKINDGGLVFDYFKNSAAMQINDGQVDNIITTKEGLMVILNIDLHFKNDKEIMYLVAFENDVGYRDRVRWRIVYFMRSSAIYNEYGVHESQLPQSSRRMRWFMDGIKKPPYNIPLDIISRTNFKSLKKKNTKRRRKGNVAPTKPKLMMTEEKLKRFCQESWYNDLIVPAVVIKGKKQWIEWKKMVRIYDEYNEEKYIGISLRYHKSNKQWKIETIEYDAGRIFYQYKLVGLSRYDYVFNEIDGKITRSVNIM